MIYWNPPLKITIGTDLSHIKSTCGKSFSDHWGRKLHMRCEAPSSVTPPPLATAGCQVHGVSHCFPCKQGKSHGCFPSFPEKTCWFFPIPSKFYQFSKVFQVHGFPIPKSMAFFPYDKSNFLQDEAVILEHTILCSQEIPPGELFIVDFPMKKWPFSIAMLVHQRVYLENRGLALNIGFPESLEESDLTNPWNQTLVTWLAENILVTTWFLYRVSSR